MIAVGNDAADAFKPRPCPALWNLERDLVVYADRLALAALLIVRPIGSAET